MVKVVCGKSRIGEALYRGEGMGQIVVGEIELGGASWTRLRYIIIIIMLFSDRFKNETNAQRYYMKPTSL